MIYKAVHEIIISECGKCGKEKMCLEPWSNYVDPWDTEGGSLCLDCIKEMFKAYDLETTPEQV